MSYVFSQMTPGATMSKYNVGLLDTFDDEKRLLNFLRMEKWLADRPHHPGEAAKQLLINLYKNNELVRGEFRLGGRRQAQDIKVPVLNVFAKDDHVIPPKTTQALRAPSAARTTPRSAWTAAMSACSSAASRRACSARASSTGSRSATERSTPHRTMKPRLRDVPVLGRDDFCASRTPSGVRPMPNAPSSACTRLAQRPRLRRPGARSGRAWGSAWCVPTCPARTQRLAGTPRALPPTRAYTRALATLIARLDRRAGGWVGTSQGATSGC
jgi:hypothetical protein